MGGRREVSIISHRPVTDLKQERSFFRGSVSTVLQLVVATYRLQTPFSSLAAVMQKPETRKMN